MELEKDLEARQEKIMGTWVESFTAMTKSHQKGELAAYTANLVLLVNKFFTKNHQQFSRLE